MKPCAKCRVEKDLVLFYPDKSKRDGRHTVCKECQLAQRKIHYRDKYDEVRAQHRSYYQRHRDDWLAAARKKRTDALAAYGGKCVCCGESTIEFLGIDHANDDGEQHRRELKGYGRAIYDWLRRQGYPQDGRFQVLCHNCNMAKGLYGLCPHQGVPPYRRRKELRAA